MSVHVLLVTAPDEGLGKFHANVAWLLLEQERRGDTVCYTRMDDHLEFALAVAETFRATVQEVKCNHGGGEETYELLHQGEAPGWAPPPGTKGGKV